MGAVNVPVTVMSPETDSSHQHLLVDRYELLSDSVHTNRTLHHIELTLYCQPQAVEQP